MTEELTHAVGASYRARVLIEGIEIPFETLSADFSVSGPGTAQITIPYVRTALALRPRSVVHVYVSENLGGATTLASGSVLTAKADHAIKNDIRTENLLYVFETHGYQVTSSSGGLFAVVSCVGLWSYFDSAKLYWGSTKAAHQGARTAAFVGATTVNSRQSGSAVGDVVSLIRSTPLSNPKARGVMAGCISLIEGAVGLQKKFYKQSYLGMNDYLTFAEARFCLTRMVFAHPDDASSDTIIDSKSFSRYFKSVSRALRSTASVGQLIHALLGKVFHSVSPVPFPPYIPRGTVVNRKERVRTGTTEYPGLQDLYRKVYDTWVLVSRRLVDALNDKIRLRNEATSANGGVDFGIELDRVAEKPRDYSAVGVEANIVYASDEHARFDREVTRINLIGTYTAEKRAAVASVIAAQFGPGTSTPKARAANLALEHLELGVDILKNILLTSATDAGERVYPNHNRAQMQRANHHLEAALKGLGGGTRGSYKTVSVPVELGGRLNAYFVAPDLFMAPPPVCNVMFPDDVSAITFGRSWMEETTRLWLHSRTRTGRDRTDIYFSPNVSSGLPNQETALEAVKHGHTFLMPHERFTGIVPKLEGLGDTDVYKKLHARRTAERRRTAEGAAKAASEQGTDAATQGALSAGRGESSPQPHMQHAANYIFFSDRYSSRYAQIQMRFMPSLVPGLPGLVLDPALVTRDDPENSVHLLGLVHRVQHTISAKGDFRTSVSMSKCRLHDDDADLFSDEGVAESKTARSSTRKLSPGNGKEFIYPVGPANKQRPGYVVIPSRLGPRSQVYTAAVPGAGRSASGRADLYTLPRDTSGLRMRVKRFASTASDEANRDGHRLVAFTYFDTGVGREVSPTANTGPEGVVVEIYREGTTSKSEKIDYDFDATLYPPWMDDLYRRERVGQDFYQLLLGCGSIIDANSAATVDTSAGINEALRQAGLDQAVDQLFPDDYGREGTIRYTVSVLASNWSAAYRAGADMRVFGLSYRARKYADMVSIHGTVVLDSRVSQTAPIRFLQDITAAPDVFATPREGFHAEACGDAKAYESIESPGTSILDVAAVRRVGGKVRAFDPAVDVRAARWRAAVDYQRDIVATASRRDNENEVSDV